MKNIEEYINEVFESNSEDRPSLVDFLDEIVTLSGQDGTNVALIYEYVEKAGYKYDKSVIRSNINKNTLLSKYKYNRNLWKRTKRGHYISSHFIK